MEAKLQSVLIVSMDKKSATDVAYTISKMLALQFVDADEYVGLNLIRSVDFPLDIADREMETIEDRSISSIANKDKIVISMSDDLFLSNKCYKKFEKSLKILVKIEKNDKIEANLQILLEKYCDIVINEKDIDFDKLIKMLK